MLSCLECQPANHIGRVSHCPEQTGWWLACPQMQRSAPGRLVSLIGQMRQRCKENTAILRIVSCVNIPWCQWCGYWRVIVKREVGFAHHVIDLMSELCCLSGDCRTKFPASLREISAIKLQTFRSNESRRIRSPLSALIERNDEMRRRFPVITGRHRVRIQHSS